MEPRSPALQADSLPAEPPGGPKAVNLQLKKKKKLASIYLSALELSFGADGLHSGMSGVRRLGVQAVLLQHVGSEFPAQGWS